MSWGLKIEKQVAQTKRKTMHLEACFDSPCCVSRVYSQLLNLFNLDSGENDFPYLMSEYCNGNEELGI